MIEFILTSWWIYLPVAVVLLFLTYRNNQKIKRIKRDRELQALPPDERQMRVQQLKRKSSVFDRILSKYGVRGIFDHIFPKK